MTAVTFNWTRVLDGACGPEGGVSFCLDEVGVLLTRTPHSGNWYYSLGDGIRSLGNMLSEEEAKAKVEKAVLEKGSAGRVP